MSVYVDDMYKHPMGRLGRMKMSHMVADTTDELLEMADAIGVARKHIQNPGTVREHFDVSLGRRQMAVEQGAVEITMRELGRMMREKWRGRQDASST